MFYENNNNFGFEQIQMDTRLKTPPNDRYKDINSSSPIPTYTMDHLVHFLLNYDKQVDTNAIEMYTNGLLLFVRYCIEGIYCFNNIYINLIFFSLFFNNFYLIF